MKKKTKKKQNFQCEHATSREGKFRKPKMNKRLKKSENCKEEKEEENKNRY